MTAIDKVIDEALNDDATSGLLLYESWEKLKGETAGAFAAFRAYRDYGSERNVRKAVDSMENDEALRANVTGYGENGRWITAGGNAPVTSTSTPKNCGLPRCEKR